MRRLFRIANWPFLVKLGIGPLLALAATIGVAWLGTGGLAEGSRATDVLMRGAAASRTLESVAMGVQAINGTLYRVLALQAAQTVGLNPAEELKPLQDQIAGIAKTLLEFNDKYATPEQKPRISALVTEVEKYKGAVDWVKEMLDIDFAATVSFLAPFDENYHRLADAVETTVREVAADGQLQAAAAREQAAATRQGFAWITGLSVLLVSAIASGIALATIRSVRSIAATTQRLANGDTGVDISALARSDELSAIVRSLDIFRDNLIRVSTLQHEQAAEKERSEETRRQALRRMADTIEAETSTAMVEIGRRVASMNETARTMQASAASTGGSAASAAASASQTLATTQTVASASEQLSASIHEISQQVGQSTSVVGRAVTAGNETRAAIEILTEKVDQIGAVADMITDIARKTNMLALNATIEAARAGDAGRGFAVVAGEVKQLALQTSNSTTEIAQRLSEIRAATGTSVSAVRSIEQTIREVEGITGSIAAAVEQQGAATAEIARNIAVASDASHAMSARVSEVSAEASRTDESATALQENAAGLAVSMTELRHAVIRAVRTSTADVDRRREPRHALALQGRLSAPGQTPQPVRTADISMGGARLLPGPSVTSGASVILVLDSLANPLPGTVLETGEAGSRLRFNLDETAAAALAQVLGRATAARAA